MINSIKAVSDFIVNRTNGRFLTVTFEKRDGTLRTINGRVGVRFGGKASPVRYDTTTGEPYFLIWSVRDRGFRRVSLNRLVKLSADNSVVYSKG